VNAGTLLGHLPAIFHGSEPLRGLLEVFEEVLIGVNSDGLVGIGQKIDRVPELFAPTELECIESEQRGDFLHWLAKWVALGRLEDIAEDQLAPLIARIVPLYGQRGTCQFLETVLKLCLPQIRSVEIDDHEFGGLVVGQARLGKDTLLVLDRPFWFFVRVIFQQDANRDSKLPERVLERRARLIIDLSKPAFTACDVECQFESSSATA
jgi:phage tail-like protein